MNLVGYRLSSQDNRTCMFEDDGMLPKCPTCGYRLNFQAHNPHYRLKSQRADLSATYDGQDVVSSKFRDFCIGENYADLTFLAFDADPHHYQLIATSVVNFDAPRRETRFENLCNSCGNYESVVGAKPCYLLVDTPLKDGFYRTDLFFASGNEKHPLIIVGIETKEKLAAAVLKGLEFSPAYGV